MDQANAMPSSIGQEVVLTTKPTQAGQPPIGTHGFITNIGHQGIPNPIQVTFEDATSTIRYYSTTQLGLFFSVPG